VSQPNRFKATPEEIMDFLREHFAEDQLEPFQWAIVQNGLREGVAEIRNELNRGGYHTLLKQWHDGFHYAVNMLDPDDKEYRGHWPSNLLGQTKKK
jgi:hypothetical protein